MFLTKPYLCEQLIPAKKKKHDYTANDVLTLNFPQRCNQWLHLTSNLIAQQIIGIFVIHKLTLGAGVKLRVFEIL